MDVIERIKEAFADVPFPFEEANADYQHAVQELRTSFGEAPYEYPSNRQSGVQNVPFHKLYFVLFLFTSDDLQYVLPRLMVRLVNHYPNEVEYAEDVINYLNASLDSDTYEFSSIDENIRQSSNFPPHIQTEIQEFKDNYLRSFNRKQAEAVLDWLQTVRNWDELSEMSSNINEAMVYWERLANMP